MKYLLSVSLIALGSAAWANCPEATVADMMGLAPGDYPQQYDLSAFEAAAGCDMTFQENPEIAALNARIQGNPESLPPVAERLPAEPLVVLPYEGIGRYGGRLDGMSNATEAGTSDMLSLRHVNLVRFADDLVTIVPNVARDFAWNGDFTELTFTLREGHRWSDGAPFTAHDIAFWYNNMVMDPNVIESPRALWMADGERFDVEALDDTTVVFRLPSPLPGLLASFAADFAQPFQPRHFLGQFHPDIDPNADANAQALGFENGYAAIAHYYGGSDWKDVPSPLLRDPSTVESLPAAVVPTLEAFITVADTTEGRRYVANPFFHMVDTAGNQLPYISEMDERYVSDNEVRILRMVNGEIDYKAQSVTLPDAPTLLDGAEAGGYTIDLRPQIGMPVFGFNVTAADEARREVFLNRDFRLAMSHAINRPEINSVAYFDLGEPRAYMHFDPVPPFATEEQATYATQFDPETAASLLDSVGLVDSNGDGVRELDGEPFTLTMQFSTQGLPTAVAELVAQHWTDVGIPTTIREVTSDEYRAAQAANELDVVNWGKGQPIPIVLGSAEQLLPPFGGFFDARTGMLWARWIETNGAEGIEPPVWTTELAETVASWQQHQPGTEASNELGQEIVSQILEAFMFIGTVQAPNPVYHSNALQNFVPPQTWSYEYYRMYPYRPQQWWLDE
jgi:peptide/nickel transport system substrate-binding protein